VHTPIVIEVQLSLVDFDGEQARGNTPDYVYSDLLFFYSLGGSRPGAVAGRLENGRVQVQSRVRYAAIAQDLGLTAVDCVLPADTPRSQLDEFLLTAGVRLARTSASDDPGASVQWHTVSFDGEVARDQLVRIEHELNEVFGRPIELRRAERDASTIYFQVLISKDRDQAVRFRGALREFDQDIAPVRSYRGGRFKRVP
jgi:hypothetical protein